MVAPSRLVCLPLLSVFAVVACGQPQASSDADKIEEAITRLDDKLTELDDRLAQMDARTAALAEQKAATSTPPAAPSLATAIEVATERAELEPSGRVEIVVDTRGLTVDGETVRLEQLESHVRNAAAGKDITVEIQADAATHHGRLIEVMDAVREAGVQRLAIAKRTDGLGLD